MNDNEILNTETSETIPDSEDIVAEKNEILLDNLNAETNIDIETETNNEISAVITENKPKKTFREYLTKQNIIIGSLLICVLLIVGIFGGIYIRDIKAANDVISKINDIGEVTIDSKDTISIAQTAYNNLSNSQKKKVKNYDILTVAIADYNEKEAALEKALYYKDLLLAGLNCEVIGEFSSAVFSDVSSVWHNAVYRKTDKYNNGNYDFNSAINNWYSTQKDELSDYFDRVENCKTELDSYMSTLKNPPAEYEKAYDALLNLYATISTMYDLSLTPEGTYVSYTSKTQSLNSEYDTKKAIWDGLVN